MQESNVNQQPKSYADVLRETQQEEFPLLSEVTQGVVEDLKNGKEQLEETNYTFCRLIR